MPSLTLTLTNQQLEAAFRALNAAQDVANLLDEDINQLNWHIFFSPSNGRYTCFQIPKKSGGHRDIKAPITAIKILQKKLNTVLNAVYNPKPFVNSFIEGRTIVRNAKNHTRRNWVLNIDLKDFFPSITFPRVRGMFLSKPYSIGTKAATYLANICCHEGVLPQGAPTSPIVSNMICAKLDGELARLALKLKCRYSRYADDIVFYCNDYIFPSELAIIKNDGSIELGLYLSHIIDENWFEVNETKTRLRRRNLCQEVTGLIVNDKVNVRRRYVKYIRAMLHAWEKFGYHSASAHYFSNHYSKYKAPFKTERNFNDIIAGKLGFLKMVLPEDNVTYLRYYKQYRRLRLLDKYNWVQTSADHKARGLILEKFLNELFKLYSVPVTSSFIRNQHAEQIDGAFEYAGIHYLVECKWVEESIGLSDFDPFSMKISRSGQGTMGLFLSINGWSKTSLRTILQNQNKTIILMNGDDLIAVLQRKVGLIELIRAKINRLSLNAEPFYSAEHYINDKTSDS